MGRTEGCSRQKVAARGGGGGVEGQGLRHLPLGLFSGNWLVCRDGFLSIGMAS